jgi:hypothetical protein
LTGLLVRFWQGVPASEVAYLLWICSTLTFGMCLLLLVLAVVWLEKPVRLRAFLKLGPVDWNGLGLVVLLTLGLNVAEAVFLRRTLFEPSRRFLLALGLWGRPSADVGFTSIPSSRS